MSLRTPMAIANRTDFRILEETENYIAVDKPAPMLVHPSTPGGPRTLYDELSDLLAYELVTGGALSIINRLDRETSGVVLVAKNPAAARSFCRAMEQRRVEKNYLALVWGWPNEDQFSIDAPLLRRGEVDPGPVWLERAVHPKGAPALTHFFVRRRFSRADPPDTRFSLIEASPVTGRMHQIRVHLQHAGHPIVGDKLYGPDRRLYLHFIEHGFDETLRRRLLWSRHALHCQRLALETAHGHRSWTATLPQEFQDFLSGKPLP
ncbi:MAG TPA: RluA family pseudouridine synthase [Verrucomicrobiales bacterium]|nr:RluA family pseudouridine synthase [Verrucomicrobiales bacterium]